MKHKAQELYASLSSTDQAIKAGDLTKKYGWMMYGISLAIVLIYSILFNYIERFIRSKRNNKNLKFLIYFKFKRIFSQYLNTTIEFDFNGFNCSNPNRFKRLIYLQPSLILLYIIYIGVNLALAYKQVNDFTFLDARYLVGRRLGQFASANMTFMFLLGLKHDPVSILTGIPQTKLVRAHRWIGRLAYGFILAHMVLAIKFLKQEDKLYVLKERKQILGILGVVLLTPQVFLGTKSFRRKKYETFLFIHGLLGAVGCFFIYFHNSRHHALLIVAIHTIVIDRVLGRIRTVFNRFTSSTQCVSEFKIIDDETVEAHIPFERLENQKKIFKYIPLPYLGYWKAGQHIYLNVPRVRLLQNHPFMISSHPNTKILRLLIRKRNGFTKHLFEKIKNKLEEDKEATITDFGNNINSIPISLRVTFGGPYGGNYLPLITFDTILFIAAGSGASLTFPILNDTLFKLNELNSNGNNKGRPEKTKIRFVWLMKNKENINWYEEEIAEVKEQFKSSNQNRLELSVEFYYTSNLGITEELGDSSITSSNEKYKEEESHMITSTGTNASSSMDLITIANDKPKSADIVGQEAKQLNCKHHELSMAVISCGPYELNEEARGSSLECMWKKGGPDIYFHTEGYEF